MLDALVSGKLSQEQENMEDLLTSIVFGSFRYVSPEEGLLRWLAEAVSLDGENPAVKIVTPVRMEYRFWPRWNESGCVGCEPDVALTINAADGTTWLVCVEAKYRSGKSSEGDVDADAPHDQLAREWDNLASLSKQWRASPLLVYITADYTPPRREIRESIEDFRRTRPDCGAPALCWLSWRSIASLFHAHSSPVLADLARLVRRLDLTFFEGVEIRNLVTPQTWAFDACGISQGGRDSFSWTIADASHAKWRFAQ